MHLFRARTVIGLLMIGWSTVASGQQWSIAFSDNCLQAQEHIYQLRLTEAHSLLTAESYAKPGNVLVDYLKANAFMLGYITSERSSDFDSFISVKNRAVKRIAKCDESDGYRDFLLEEIYFYSSVVNGKRGYTLSAANDVRNSYKYGNRVIEDHPQFKAALKTIGLLNSGFGSLPNTYQKLVRFLGYETSMDKGVSMLEEFIKHEDIKPEWILLQKEAAFYLASIHLYLKNDKPKAWEMIAELTVDYKTNPLSAFARVNFADKCKKNEVVISTIEELMKDEEHEDIPFLWFMLGKAKLQRLDPDASAYLLKYIETHEGSSYVKSCYQKLAWHALILGDEKGSNTYFDKIKEHGNDHLEEDAQALKASNSGLSPHPDLLKTRLLFDGGYYKNALFIIRPFNSRDFDSDLLKTEYLYRKGRIYDALEDVELAEAFYLEAMEQGEHLSTYYASYSALYLAEIHERNQNPSKAKVYFQRATSFSDNKEYRKSIEHRAKNGLERIQ